MDIFDLEEFAERFLLGNALRPLTALYEPIDQAVELVVTAVSPILTFLDQSDLHSGVECGWKDNNLLGVMPASQLRSFFQTQLISKNLTYK